MRLTFGVMLLAGISLMAPQATSGQQASPVPTVASVQTLTLQDTIRSWGRLGGMAIDRLGFLYISSFGESVWRVTPDGAVTRLADDIYGASGMTIGPDGALYQASFFDNSIRRIGRDGTQTVWATGLRGPVGVVPRGDGTLFVVNCADNSVSMIGPDGTESTISRSELFACPNGIALVGDDLYIVNFSNNNFVKVDAEGNASLFTTIGQSEGRAAGHGHIAVVGDHFFVTTVKTSSLWRVSMDGTVTQMLGPSQPANADGAPDEARISNPNAIVAVPGRMGPLFLNTIEAGQWGTTAPTHLSIRRIVLEAEGD
jgi:hypothetical protein